MDELMEIACDLADAWGVENPIAHLDLGPSGTTGKPAEIALHHAKEAELAAAMMKLFASVIEKFPHPADQPV